MKIHKIIALFLPLTVLTFPLSASDKELSESNPLLVKRPFVGDPAQDIVDQPPRKKNKVFARPTYDSTFKHILTDDEIRLEFIKTFTGLTEITSTTKLDESLTPLREFSNLREIFDNENNMKFLDWVNASGNKIKITGPDLGPEKKIVESPVGLQFLRDLSAHREQLSHIFPKPRNSQLDILCQLPDKSYVMVEIQVASQDFWDKRALAYLASIYGRQLREGDKWSSLRQVIGVNILVGGPKGLPEWKSCDPNKPINPIRHYKFQEKNDPNLVIPEMQLIQFSLGNTDLETPPFQENSLLRNWVDYFKNAHKKEAIPEDASNALKKAYEVVTIKSMGKEMKEQYEKEKGNFDNFKAYTATAVEHGMTLGRKKEKQAIAVNLLEQNISIDTIKQATGLSEDEIKALAQ